MTRRSSPYHRADKGVALRTGRDDRLEYTRYNGPPSAPVFDEDTKSVDGWRWTRTAYNDLATCPSLHYRDVRDALCSPTTIRPGNTKGTSVHERDLVKAIVSGRTVLAVHARA